MMNKYDKLEVNKLVAKAYRNYFEGFFRFHPKKDEIIEKIMSSNISFAEIEQVVSEATTYAAESLLGTEWR